MSAERAVPSSASSYRAIACRNSPALTFASASLSLCFAGGVARRLQPASEKASATQIAANEYCQREERSARTSAVDLSGARIVATSLRHDLAEPSIIFRRQRGDVR